MARSKATTKLKAKAKPKAKASSKAKAKPKAKTQLKVKAKIKAKPKPAKPLARASLQNFKKNTAKTGESFLVLTKVPGLKVQLQFTGMLEHKEVLWDAEFQTLASYHNEFLASLSEKERAKEVYSFIDVKEPVKQAAKLHLVMAIPLFDEPAIKKAIIMIRCYKKLKPGKHVFGKNK